MNAKTRFKKILEFKKKKGRKRAEVRGLIAGGEAYEIGFIKSARFK